MLDFEAFNALAAIANCPIRATKTGLQEATFDDLKLWLRAKQISERAMADGLPAQVARVIAAHA